LEDEEDEETKVRQREENEKVRRSMKEEIKEVEIRRAINK